MFAGHCSFVLVQQSIAGVCGVCVCARADDNFQMKLPLTGMLFGLDQVLRYPSPPVDSI